MDNPFAVAPGSRSREASHKILQWTFGPGGLLVAYYVFGCWAYKQLEGWNFLDSSYFLTVAATTVGYGDYTPVSWAGRLFTSIYIVLGITFIFNAMGPIVAALLVQLRALIGELVDAVLFVVRDIFKLRLPRFVDDAMTEGRMVGYVRAVEGPVVLIALGVLFAWLVIGYGLIDSLYWSVCTMTTIGFGDLAPNATWYQKVSAIFYLPLAVTALADSIAELSKLSTCQRIRDCTYERFVDLLLLHECRGDPHETLTEAEFLVSVLKGYNLVDDVTLDTVRQQFSRVVRHGRYTQYDARMLTPKILFMELTAQDRVQQSSFCNLKKALSSHAATPIDRLAFVNMEAADGGFQEWFDDYWTDAVSRVNALDKAAGRESIKSHHHEKQRTLELESRIVELENMPRKSTASEKEILTAKSEEPAWRVHLRHGAILAAYYLLGVWAYGKLEGWGALDSCYFMTGTRRRITSLSIHPLSAHPSIGSLT